MGSTFNPYLELFKKALSEELRKVVEVAVDTGMVTSATSTTLTDTTKNWPTDQWKDYVVEITSGTGEGQIRKIVSNTNNTLTVDPPWTTTPDTTSRYAIRFVGVGVMSISAWGGTSLTGRDITQDIQKLQNLDIALSAHKDAILGTGAKTLTDIDNALTSLTGIVATESTLSGIKAQTDKLTFDASNRLKTQLDSIPNPSNLDVALSTLVNKFTNVSTYGSIASGDNTAGFSVSLEVAHRAHVEVWVKLGGAGDIKVYGSRNGSDWRLVDSDSLSAAGEWHKGYLNAYKYIKVEVPTTGIDVEIEITANP